MRHLIQDLIDHQADIAPDRPALWHRGQPTSYQNLATLVEEVAGGLLATGIAPGDRVAVYLPKQVETAASLMGAARAGACFVPVNPLLKPRQVGYILRHCQARVLITSWQRLSSLVEELQTCDHLHTLIVTDEEVPGEAGERMSAGQTLISWRELGNDGGQTGHRRIDADMAAILYTSGSTGQPKGVVLSHRNLVAGAESVATYLENRPTDRILAVLPLSFDAGLSQLTTAFHSGASAVLMDYLLPGDVIRTVVEQGITGLAAVPPLWHQLLQQEWPPEVAQTLRYITNTGGAMPESATRQLRRRLPQTRVYLMYGLTEAFRSTYLPPDQVDLRPRSIGKAIPNADILVLNERGEPCGPNEPGELVHRGALVAMGYWNDPEKTAERFRPIPARSDGLPVPELAVWSGDQVVRDEEGYLYFVTRKDEMIKTSGYRVSPTEIEEVAFSSGLAGTALALGIPHEQLGQAILLIVTPSSPAIPDDQLADQLLRHCRKELPAFMHPHHIHVRDSLPCNPNGKFDRQRLRTEYLEEKEPEY